MDYLLGKKKKGTDTIISVVFSNIQDFDATVKQTKGGRNINIISFTEDGIEYCYALGPNGYKDVYGNGPDFDEYEITQDRQRVNDAINGFDPDPEDDDDDWFDQLAKANANHTRQGQPRQTGCGGGSSGCGGSSSGSSGSSTSYGCGPGSMGGACGGSSRSYSGCGGSRSYGC